jgi:hypothetical protein
LPSTTPNSAAPPRSFIFTTVSFTGSMTVALPLLPLMENRYFEAGS